MAKSKKTPYRKRRSKKVSTKAMTDKSQSSSSFIGRSSSFVNGQGFDRTIEVIDGKGMMTTQRIPDGKITTRPLTRAELAKIHSS